MKRKYNKIIFSIVISCYNLGSVIQRSIDSIIGQSLLDVEIIVVDDASNDKETQKKIDELELGGDVQIIRLAKNGGVSVARNTGIEAARGKYILCLDADDYIDSTYLEKAQNIFESDESIGIVSCGVQCFGSSSSKYFPKDQIEIKDALVNSPVHTASCFRKSDWESGAIYDPALRGYEDWDHWLRIMKMGKIVRVIPEPLFNYYVRPGSKVETSNRNAFDLVSGIVENHKELYRDHFSYVIAKKHEIIGCNVNAQRELQKNKISNQPSSMNSPGDELYSLRIRSWRDVPRVALKTKKKIFPKRWF